MPIPSVYATPRARISVKKIDSVYSYSYAFVVLFFKIGLRLYTRTVSIVQHLPFGMEGCRSSDTGFSPHHLLL